ncbi:MAG: D-aminoacyl-tRNA deacylase [Nitrospinota bacterium]
MRAVVQRVKRACVTVAGQVRGSIGSGLLVFVGVEKGDGPKDLETMASKISGLRIFEDESGKMNLNVTAVGGELLLVPQFTITGTVKKGTRPSFTNAEVPKKARKLFTLLVSHLKSGSGNVTEGAFQEDMDVELVNDGPVTILIDSRRTF